MQVANRGIDGDTTAGVLARLDTVETTKAEVAILMLGRNDLQQRLDMTQILTNYQSLIERLQQLDIKVVVQSVVYTDGQQLNNDNIRQLNQKLAQLCQQNQVTYVDLNAALAAKGKLEQQHSLDGLHLTGVGYYLWANTLRSALSEATSAK